MFSGLQKWLQNAIGQAHVNPQSNVQQGQAFQNAPSQFQTYSPQMQGGSPQGGAPSPFGVSSFDFRGVQPGPGASWPVPQPFMQGGGYMGPHFQGGSAEAPQNLQPTLNDLQGTMNSHALQGGYNPSNYFQGGYQAVTPKNPDYYPYW